MLFTVQPPIIVTSAAAAAVVIGHGQDLIAQGAPGANVGPTFLIGSAGYPGTLETMTLPPRGFWRGDTPNEFAPTGTYVYNNIISNKGGVVPGGGMTIDGYSIPAGVKVVQFRDFSVGDIFMGDSTSFMFRGCRFRFGQRAPGFFNCAVGAASALFYFFFNDMGGIDASSDANVCEVPCKIANAAGALCYRNYLTYIGTAFQLNILVGAEITENYIDKLSNIVSLASHLNGMTFNGGETCALILRNHSTAPNPDERGLTINQTDNISFFQDFGDYPGTGTNRDGSVGYNVKDNYVGGTGFCIYAGKNAGSGANSVNNMVVTGTRVTTQWYANGGFNGPIAAEPVWGTLGNSKSNNTWADGPNAGLSAF